MPALHPPPTQGYFVPWPKYSLTRLGNGPRAVPPIQARSGLYTLLHTDFNVCSIRAKTNSMLHEFCEVWRYLLFQSSSVSTLIKSP